jgi:hypothetical protein
MPLWIHPLIGLALTLVLAGLVFRMIARMGWREFAARHGYPGPAVGPSFLARRVRFNDHFATYNNAIRVTVLPKGLHFRLGVGLPLAHDPFLMSWRNVVSARRTQTRWGERYVVDLADGEGRIQASLSPQAQAAIETYLPAGTPQTQRPRPA